MIFVVGWESKIAGAERSRVFEALGSGKNCRFWA